MRFRVTLILFSNLAPSLPGVLVGLLHLPTVSRHLWDAIRIYLISDSPTLYQSNPRYIHQNNVLQTLHPSASPPIHTPIFTPLPLVIGTSHFYGLPCCLSTLQSPFVFGNEQLKTLHVCTAAQTDYAQTVFTGLRGMLP